MDIKPIDPSLIPDELPEVIETEGPLNGTLNSITIEIPNGLQVELARPTVSTVNLLARIFSESDLADKSSAYNAASVCMYVTAIDGVSQGRPTSLPELQALQNKLLDPGLMHIAQAIVEYFPESPKLKVLKKNLR